MTEPFNQPLYDATLVALAENGVPPTIAFAAAQVVASDDATKSDLGRSPQDQLVVDEAMHHCQNQQTD